jgi:malate synthase
MEDAATAEICRSQVWQWLRHGATLDDGAPLTPERFHRVLDEEIEGIRAGLGEERFRSGRFPEARDVFERLSTSSEFEDFLTIPAYEHLLSIGG